LTDIITIFISNVDNDK